MNVKPVHLFRFILLAIGISAVTGCERDPAPILLEKYCVGDSGLSQYWVKISTAEESGSIRYRYMDQDVFYAVSYLKITDGIISGRANFQKSLTGEKRGSPLLFEYDTVKNTLKDGGAVEATCQHLQPTVAD